MTRKSPTAPRQVELTHALSVKINDHPFLFVNSDEVESESKVPDGEWLHRIETFLNDPESGISSDELERQWCTAMITRRYKKYLNANLVGRLTACLKPVKTYPPKDREARLEQLKEGIKQIESGR